MGEKVVGGPYYLFEYVRCIIGQGNLVEMDQSFNIHRRLFGFSAITVRRSHTFRTYMTHLTRVPGITPDFSAELKIPVILRAICTRTLSSPMSMITGPGSFLPVSCFLELWIYPDLSYISSLPQGHRKCCYSVFIIKMDVATGFGKMWGSLR